MVASERIHDLRVAPAAPREIDAWAIWRAILRHKGIVALTAIAVTAGALYLALTSTFIFRGEAIITAVHDTGEGGMGSLGGGLGGLASLAGLNLTESAQDQERQGVLHSRRLVEEFIKRNGVLPLLSRDSKTPLTLWFAVDKFRKSSLVITEDKVKGLTTVDIEWTDPATAARWTNAFVGLANELIRTKVIEEAGRNIDYLNQQIAHTSDVELQRVMYNIIETETKRLMLAKGRSEYAFTIVDPAVTPEKRVRPKRTLMVLTGLVVGTLLGGVTAVIYDTVQRRRRALSPPPRQ